MSFISYQGLCSHLGCHDGELLSVTDVEQMNLGPASQAVFAFRLWLSGKGAPKEYI